MVFVLGVVWWCLYSGRCGGVCTRGGVVVFVLGAVWWCLYWGRCGGVCTGGGVVVFVLWVVWWCLYWGRCGGVCTGGGVVVFVLRVVWWYSDIGLTTCWVLGFEGSIADVDFHLNGWLGAISGQFEDLDLHGRKKLKIYCPLMSVDLA